MQGIIINIDISADEYLKLYKGQAKDVVTRAMDGRTVRFPAAILQPFVQRSGVKGRFRIVFDSKGKFQGIERV